MKTLVYFDAAGNITATGQCPDDTPEMPGTMQVFIPAGVTVSPFSHSIVGGVLVDVPSMTPTSPDVADLRREAYPPVREQLDALWHGMEAGLLPKVPAFFEPIAAVKTRLPKDRGA